MSHETPWMTFKSWIDRHRGSEDETRTGDRLTESGTSGPVSTEVSSTGRQIEEPQNAQVESELSSKANKKPSRPPLARDCRTETRLTEGALSRGRQEMTLVLAAPGLPLSKAALISAKQAGALLQILCEPLVQVSVGRLTRCLESPQSLRPTEDKGVISLWLLPNDDLSLVWQSTISQGANSGRIIGNHEPSSSGESLFQEVGGEISLIEELARFPAGSHLHSDEPLVTVHMLRGDKGGRSFYIKPRNDISDAHTAHGPLADLVASSGVDIPGSGPSFDAKSMQNNQLETGNSETKNERRLYFWLREKSLPEAMHKLGRLKSLVKRPPTLSRRSGVPQHQLDEIASWLQMIEKKNMQKPTSFESNSGEDLESEEYVPLSSGEMAGVKASERSKIGESSSRITGHVPINEQRLESRERSNSRKALPDGSLLNRASGLGQIIAPAENSTSILPNGGLSASATVTATAAAIYRDRRFQISCPCNITVGAYASLQTPPISAMSSSDRNIENETGSSIQSNESSDILSFSKNDISSEDASRVLALMASARAKFKAEDAARSILDRLGRQRVEEKICENLLHSTRAQRQRAKNERNVRREMTARQKVIEEAMPLIRRAAESASASLQKYKIPMRSENSQKTIQGYDQSNSNTDIRIVHEVPLDYAEEKHFPSKAMPVAKTQSVSNNQCVTPAFSCEQDIGQFNASLGTVRSYNSADGSNPLRENISPASPRKSSRVTIANLESIFNVEDKKTSCHNENVLGCSVDEAMSGFETSSQDEIINHHQEMVNDLHMGNRNSQRSQSAKITVGDLIDLFHSSNRMKVRENGEAETE